MDYVFEQNWKRLIEKLEEQFGEDLSVEAILFLIGVQELGQGSKRFKKDEKMNLMHIAICRVLEPYGYYRYSHLDEERWPHYELIKPLPHLGDKEQKDLLRRAILEYFEEAISLEQ
jgi:hypothetical protein